MPAAIIDTIRSAENLPSLPTVAVQVLTMTQADDVSVAELARTIQQDPALTGRLLKVVNSSLFGMSRKISSLQQAMVVLGLRTVKVMALSFSLVDTMRGRTSGGFDFAGFWRRSLTAAVASRMLCEELHDGISDEAFVGGLLCDIGMLAAWRCARPMYMPVIEKYENGGETIQAVEKEILGATHEEMSHELLNHWGLPELLCTAVKTHHSAIADPAGSDGPGGLTRILRSAAMIADLFCADLRVGSLDALKVQISHDLPLSNAALSKILSGLNADFAETASLFALNVGSIRNYQEIQAEACVQLARLTMAAELERAQIAQREQAVRRKVEELSDANQKLAQQATTDALTGIGNRAAFQQRLEGEFVRAAKARESVGIVMLDLDRFKKLNDTFGHQAGDEALRHVGTCLAGLASDTCFPCRYGGEEFALVMTNPEPRQLREFAEQVRAAIQQLRVPHENKFISLTASIGAAMMHHDEPHFEAHELLERADRCLYDAKHGGRNRVIVMDEGASAIRG